MATLKQKKAVKELLENTGMAVSTAMARAGYPPATAKNPQQLTRSKAWPELMEKYLPDNLLAKKHKELLMVPKKVRHFKKGELESEYEELDSQAIGKGLDMAYKLKGSYAPEKTVNVNIEATVAPEDLSLAKNILDQRRRSETSSAPSDGAISEPVGGEVQNQE